MSEYSTNAMDTIESKQDFAQTERGQWEFWEREMNASENAAKKWQKQGNKTVAKYANDRSASEEAQFRLNLFHSNIATIKAMMFGKLPEIEFSRQNQDPDDDAARVAAMMFQRMLSADIGTPNDQYSETLRNCLEDRLLPGLGVARVRYTFDEEKRNVAPVLDQQTGATLQQASTQTVVTNERAPLDYVHWRDFRWSPARTWAEVRWVAFKTLLTQDEGVEKWGEKIGKALPLDASRYTKLEQNYQEQSDPKQDAWKRIEVWEIWDKDTKQVLWWCKGYNLGILGAPEKDPLQLTGFFPNPEPMTSNVTTTAFMPIPDYVIAQDLYLEIDKLETRISLITEAVKVVGVYNSSEDGIKRMMTEAVENDLIPVNQWAAFAEKGGIQGAIDWMPIAEIADVLSKLVERRNDVKAMLYEINGISDIMRGAQAAGGAVSATERALEARFASVRIQALQDEFAKYATDLIRLRAEVVAKHFQPESIVKQSNVEFLPDKDLIQPALNLIKNDPRLIWRIQVKPESVAMVDYAQLKQERTDYITALATYFQSAAPLIQLEPEVTPVLLELLKWGMAGFKGSNEVEGILDQAIQQMQQAKSKGGEENKEPSPEQIKAEAEQRKIQAEQQKQKVDQDFEREKWQYDQKFAQMEARLNSMEIKAKLDADLQKEAAQASFNIQEEQNETVESIKREEAKADLTMEVDDNRTRNTEREHDD